MSKIGNFRKNCMGTVSFIAKFGGMHKPQEFIVYPCKTDEAVGVLTVQSDTRFGKIDITSGKVDMSKPKANACSVDLMLTGSVIDTLNAEEMLALKAAVMATASGKAGTNGVTCDNGGAINIFG